MLENGLNISGNAMNGNPISITQTRDPTGMQECLSDIANLPTRTLEIHTKSRSRLCSIDGCVGNTVVILLFLNRWYRSQLDRPRGENKTRISKTLRLDRNCRVWVAPALSRTGVWRHNLNDSKFDVLLLYTSKDPHIIPLLLNCTC